MQRLFNDPLLAGLIWRLALLLFATLLYLALRDEDDPHEWWGDFMVNVKLARDADDGVMMSRTLFKWLAVLSLILLVVHLGALVRRAHPQWFGADVVKVTETEPQPDLPKARYGEGGGGQITPGTTRAPGEGDGPVAGEGGGGRFDTKELTEE